METISVSFVLNLKPWKQNQTNKSRRSSRFCSPTHFLPLCSKQSLFQDFQDHVKPSRLLQAEEIKLCTEISEEKVISFRTNDESLSLYKVELGTSRFSGSSLSDTNAGVLLCLIDENGVSILQRIPASLAKNQSSDSDNEPISFQRGSLDEFTFEGPKLKRIKALWIGLESGQWRLDKVSLTVICRDQQSVKENSEEFKYIIVKYEFQAEDIKLGERTETSMLELRPSLITEQSSIDPLTTMPESTSIESKPISNEQSMKEYANLKRSLLLYDAALVLIGALSASFSVGEHAGLAFLGGGVSGFLYLLLLQRSVDGISAPELSSQNIGTNDKFFDGYKGPISSLALAIGLCLFAIKYSSGDFPVEFTATDLVLGMMGFLACKVSVVLAAFKPVSKGFED